MKLLLVGGGGREHALAWKLLRDDPALDLLAAPGNPGIASMARCFPIASSDLPALLELARRERVDVVLVGPEGPLAAGIVDVFRGAGIPIFGPTRGAAEIETSKSFAKALMVEAGVPTARAEVHRDAAAARRAIRSFGAPVVIKATGLASGKGVVVARSMDEADQAVDFMLRRRGFGEAGSEILVEEHMQGEELSVFAITDGTRYELMLPIQDHKRLLDGDLGPNTGGMGAYAPVSAGSTAALETVRHRILEPTLRALREHGRPFTGLLYVGLMLTPEGPRVVEFNCRFGDPETQAILPLMRSSLLDLVLCVAQRGALSGDRGLTWESASSLATVVATPGYPQAPVTGARIVLPPAPQGVIVFHSGTRLSASDVLESAGGRVLTVTAVAPTLREAQQASLGHARAIGLPDKQYRSDIGKRELERGAGAP